MTDTVSGSRMDPRPEEPENPDTDGPVPHPDHHIQIPGAPSTHPPEPPMVPSSGAFGTFWSMYGPTSVLVAVGLAIVIFVLGGIGS
ncbi:hypothetical protein [Terrihabitans rhizophilus]|jgi:hypothetical protein|nr:hypothetical protein [Terrihabitans sp. PJ23]